MKMKRRRWQAGVLGWLVACAAVAAGDEPESWLLWPQGAPEARGTADADRPRLILYPAAEPNGTGVVVLPGGGYGGLAMGHEGHDVARWLNSLGISAFINDYRHRGKGYGHPAPLQDAQRGVRIVRRHAAKWGVDPSRIGVMGFSAGGHLASTAGTQFTAGDKEAEDPIERVSSRPDFLILCYPVIAFGESYTHRGSQVNLLGANAPAELLERMSSQRRVTPETPPTFLWHTSEDKSVPPENSVQFYLALRRHQVPAELHVFQQGRHGLGLARDTPGASHWPALCITWLRRQNMLPNE